MHMTGFETDPRRLWTAFRRSVTMALALVAVIAAIGGIGVAGPAADAASGRQVVPGKGTWIAGHTDFVGYYRAQVAGHWVKVYCVSPDKAAPIRIDLRTVSRVGSASVTATRQLAETLSAHGDAQTATQAEAVSQALNEEIGNHRAVLRRAHYLPRNVQTLAMRYVREARARSGPYTLRLHLPTSPLPGQSGIGTVTLRSAAGGVASAVTLRHTANVATPATIRTDDRGRASFTYRTVAGGAVHVAAFARVAPTTVRASQAGRSTQLMLTWSRTAAARATATYQGTGPRFTHRYECSNVCDGHPNVTLTACAPASSYPSRITYWYGGQTHDIAFAAAHSRVCKSWQVILADGVSVSATWRYRTPDGWTQPLPAAGWFTVDCPPAPPVAVAISYDCTDATLAVALGRQVDGSLVPLRNRTTHRMVLVIGGALAGRFDLAPGAIARVHSYPIKCGTPAAVTVQGGIQRASGPYNYGVVATLTTP
jgi:hypothetical protein